MASSDEVVDDTICGEGRNEIPGVFIHECKIPVEAI